MAKTSHHRNDPRCVKKNTHTTVSQNTHGGNFDRRRENKKKKKKKNRCKRIADYDFDCGGCSFLLRKDDEGGYQRVQYGGEVRAEANTDRVHSCWRGARHQFSGGSLKPARHAFAVFRHLYGTEDDAATMHTFYSHHETIFLKDQSTAKRAGKKNEKHKRQKKMEMRRGDPLAQNQKKKEGRKTCFVHTTNVPSSEIYTRCSDENKENISSFSQPPMSETSFLPQIKDKEHGANMYIFMDR